MTVDNPDLTKHFNNQMRKKIFKKRIFYSLHGLVAAFVTLHEAIASVADGGGVGGVEQSPETAIDIPPEPLQTVAWFRHGYEDNGVYLSCGIANNVAERAW